MNSSDRLSRLMPGPRAILFLTWLFGLLLLYQTRLLNGDGDPARHIRHGLWILDHGSLIHQDPFSFTRFGDPFVGFEYGSQVLLASAHRAAGLPGVMALVLILLALGPTLVAWFLDKRSVDPLLSFLGGMVAGVVALCHFMARPHIITLLLTIVLLDWLERERRPPLWRFLILFVLWANLHGGVLFGSVLVGMYMVSAAIDEAGRSRHPGRSRDVRNLGTILLVSVAALFLTPYGLAIPAHLADFFGDPYLQDRTGEFLSPNFHSILLKPFLAVLLVVLVGLAWIRPRPPVRWVLVITATVGFALLAQRNVALFAYTGLPLFLLHLDKAWRAIPDWGKLRSGFAEGARVANNNVWIASGGLAVVLLALNGGRLGGIQLLTNGFDERTFPVSIVREARAQHLEGRLYHEFTWGGWLLYAWPEQKVFIDGGTDFYGSDLLRSYLSIQEMTPGWRDSLAAYGVTMTLLATDSPLANELVRDPSWGVWECDATGVLLTQTPQSRGDGGPRLDACLEERRKASYDR